MNRAIIMSAGTWNDIIGPDTIYKEFNNLIVTKSIKIFPMFNINYASTHGYQERFY